MRFLAEDALSGLNLYKNTHFRHLNCIHCFRAQTRRKTHLLSSWHLCCSNLPKKHLFCPSGHSLKTPLSSCYRDPQLHPMRCRLKPGPDLAIGWAELSSWLRGMLVHCLIIWSFWISIPAVSWSCPGNVAHCRCKNWVPKVLHLGVCCASTTIHSIIYSWLVIISFAYKTLNPL